MLGAYAVVVPERRFETHGNAELDRYLRWEYGGNMSVSAFLAGAARVSKKSRTKGRRSLADGIRALAKAFGAIRAGRTSKVPEPEV